MLEQARDELKDSLHEEIKRKSILNISEYFETLVPEIVDDIIKATTTGRNRTNYLTRYWDHDHVIISSVISVAETIATKELYKIQSNMAEMAISNYYDDSDNDYSDY